MCKKTHKEFIVLGKSHTFYLLDHIVTQNPYSLLLKNWKRRIDSVSQIVVSITNDILDILKDSILSSKKSLFFKWRKCLGDVFFVKRKEFKGRSTSGFCPQVVLMVFRY